MKATTVVGRPNEPIDLVGSYIPIINLVATIKRNYY